MVGGEVVVRELMKQRLDPEGGGGQTGLERKKNVMT